MNKNQSIGATRSGCADTFSEYWFDIMKITFY